MNFAKTLQLIAAVAITVSGEESRRVPFSGKEGLLRAFNRVTAKDSIECKETEETCYDDDWNAVSCAPIAGGGCPCPEGQEKCGASDGWAGYCIGKCCNEDSETCYDDNYEATSCALFADGGCPCPEGLEKCGGGDDWAGYCTTLCCDEDSETCYDDNYDPTSCALIADGGCPCPEGQEKCGATDSYAGYCIGACCDWETEETCYGDNYEATSCALISDGGCPCPEGEEECSDSWGGYCTTLCCDEDSEICYDDNYDATSCALIADGGCPCPEGEVKCGANEAEGWTGYCVGACCDSETEYTCFDNDWNAVSCALRDGGVGCPSGTKEYDAKEKYVSKFILAKGTSAEVHYYHDLVAQQERAVSDGKASRGSSKMALKQKEMKLFRAIKVRAEYPFAKFVVS